jgi:hypothetical protein
MYLFLHILRRLGLGIGAYVAVFTYYNPSMATSNAQAIAFGVALVAFSLPGIPRMPRRNTARPRGFEVVVADKSSD